MKKYRKVHKEEYDAWYADNAVLRAQVEQDKRRLRYHLMPETGWLNDPNGLCQHNGLYHIYYQYTPFEPTGEIKLWGHYTTRDFIRYTREAPAIFPDADCDAHGVYSGGAIASGGKLHYFYTGNVKCFDRSDYDYILRGRRSNTVHLVSEDGYHFSAKEVVLTNDDYPADLSCHVRDPKVFRHGGAYFMLLGARETCDKGAVLLYHSDDLRSWSYAGRITTKEAFGYMWECPDLFELGGQTLLICCPQGVQKKGMEYENVYQCTVMKLQLDLEQAIGVAYVDDEIRSLDRGFDFYAPQTFLDECGRRIMIAWMGIPDAPYRNPTVSDGWQHALTLPRELVYQNGRLLQKPLDELRALRASERAYDIPAMKIVAATLVYEAELCFVCCKTLLLCLRRGVTLRYQSSVLTLDVSSCGCGRTNRRVNISALRSLRVFSDTTSIEIFVNDGEEVFTSRVYGMDACLSAEGHCQGRMTLYELSAFDILSGQKRDKAIPN